MRSGFRAVALAALLALAPTLGTAQADRPSAEAIAAETRVQQGYALRAFLADVDRVERVAFPLLRAAEPYCAERRQWTLGAAPRSVGQLPPALRDAASQLGFDERLSYALVIAGTPLAAAGVQPGDHVLAVAGAPVPGGPPALPWYHQQVHRQWAVTQRPLALVVQRGGRDLELQVTPIAVCAVALRLVLSDAVNAAAGVNGQLLVSSGMLRFAADDADLALVLGHELAHGVLRHPDTLAAAAKARGAPRGNAPLDATSQMYSQQRERDADRLGLFITAAAGHDIAHAADLWRRMAVRAPSAIQGSFSASHPSSPERFLQVQAVTAEIAERRRRGDPPLPPLAELKLHPDAPDAAAVDEVAQPLPLPTLAQLPFLNDEGRAAFQAFVNTRERPRALALSLRGHVSMRSGANAADEALASCNVLARGACRLVAVDDAWLGGQFAPVTAAPPPASAAQ